MVTLPLVWPSSASGRPRPSPARSSPLLGQQLVDGDVVQPGQALQPGHGDGPLAAFVGPEHRRLELLRRGHLDGLQRQPLLLAHLAQALADLPGVGGRHLFGHSHPFNGYCGQRSQHAACGYHEAWLLSATEGAKHQQRFRRHARYHPAWRSHGTSHPGDTVRSCPAPCSEPTSAASRTPSCSPVRGPSSTTTCPRASPTLPSSARRWRTAPIGRDRPRGGPAGRPACSPSTTAADLGIDAFHGFMVLNAGAPGRRSRSARSASSGEPIVAVVAETKAAAVDAAEPVVVDYEPLAAAVDPEEALAPGAPAPVRGAGHQPGGRASARPTPIRWPAPTTWCALRMVNQRIAVVPMEGNAIAGGPRRRRRRPRPDRLRVDPDAARLRRRHRRGSSGSTRTGSGWSRPTSAGASAARRGSPPSTAPPSWLRPRARPAGQMGRDPSENMLSMHGRGQVQYVEMGFDAGRHDHRPARAGWSATPAPTAASAVRWRWVRPG